MSRDIGNPRFIPHLVLHEFETWVIASVAVGADSLIPPEAAARLRPHIESVSSDVELLDDSPTTAPSRRVTEAWPGYLKVADGVATVQEAGLERIADVCPGLSTWLSRLRALS